MSHLVNVGSDPVVIADGDILAEGEDQDEGEAGGNGREGTGSSLGKAIDHNYNGGKNEKVCED